MSFNQIDRHKFNLNKDIELLFKKMYENKIKNNTNKSFSTDNKRWQDQIDRINGDSSAESFKAITISGGTYEADLLFDKGKSIVKDKVLVKKITDFMIKEIELDSSALFGFEGGASSEGSAKINQRLSKNRAKALYKEIIKKYPQYKSNIKVMSMGESILVCEQGLFPEENTKGNYECPNKEDKVKSRRVIIRRIR